jgi:hypothetical protein
MDTSQQLELNDIVSHYCSFDSRLYCTFDNDRLNSFSWDRLWSDSLIDAMIRLVAAVLQMDMRSDVTELITKARRCTAINNK